MIPRRIVETLYVKALRATRAGSLVCHYVISVSGKLYV
jgi:hypothetical protein